MSIVEGVMPLALLLVGCGYLLWHRRPGRIIRMDRLPVYCRNLVQCPRRTPLLNAAVARGWTTNDELDRILTEQLKALDDELRQRGIHTRSDKTLEA